MQLQEALRVVAIGVQTRLMTASYGLSSADQCPGALLRMLLRFLPDVAPV